MLLQIALGSGLLMVSLLISAGVALALEWVFGRLTPWLLAEPHPPKLGIVLLLVAVGVLGIITVSVWIWAIALFALGALPTLETSVYFSLVSFTTLGFGDVILPMDWRILSGMIAANGFVNFGLLTALMVEALRHVRLGQHEVRKNRHAPASDQGPTGTARQERPGIGIGQRRKKPVQRQPPGPRRD